MRILCQKNVRFDIAVQHNLFGAFERLHVCNEYTGTVLGMATAKRVVQSHGDLIRAKSQVSQSTAFYFTPA